MVYEYLRITDMDYTFVFTETIKYTENPIALSSTVHFRNLFPYTAVEYLTILRNMAVTGDRPAYADQLSKVVQSHYV